MGEMIESAPTEPTEECWTIKQLAAFLQVAEGTIYNAISAGRLSKADGVIHLGHRTTRIHKTTFMKRFLACQVRIGGR